MNEKLDVSEETRQEVIRRAQERHHRDVRIARDMGLPKGSVRKILAEAAGVAEVTAAKSQRQIEQNTHRNKGIVRVLAVALVMITGVALYLYVTRLPTEDDAARNLSSVVQGYLAKRPPDNWYVHDQVKFEDANSMQEQIKADLNGMLARHSSLPAVAKQAQMFSGKFMVEFFDHAMGDPKKGNPFDLPADHIGLILFDELSQNYSMVEGEFALYESNWKAILIGGVEFSPQWKDALIIHELNHAVADREGKFSSHALMLSDDWSGEEVEAHELESAVLNQTTAGAYEKELQTIVDSKNARNTTELLATLKTADMQKLDALFGPASNMEANLRFAQYVQDLTSFWLIHHPPEKGSLRNAKIANYRSNYNLVSRME